MTGLRDERRKYCVLDPNKGTRFVCASERKEWFQGPSRSPRGADSPEVKLERKTDHSPVSSEEDKNTWSYYYALVCIHGMPRDKYLLALRKPKIILYAYKRLQCFITSKEFNSTRNNTNYKYRRVTYNNRYESRQDLSF